jgi:hypothetical protein
MGSGLSRAHLTRCLQAYIGNALRRRAWLSAAATPRNKRCVHGSEPSRAIFGSVAKPLRDDHRFALPALPKMVLLY